MKPVLDVREHRYWLHLQLKHPHMTIAEVTQGMADDAPDYAWEAGAVPFSAWMLWERVGETRGVLDFGEELLDLFDWLALRRDFLVAFTESGGVVNAQLQLDGRCFTPPQAIPRQVLQAALDLNVGLQFGMEGKANTVPAAGAD